MVTLCQVRLYPEVVSHPPFLRGALGLCRSCARGTELPISGSAAKYQTHILLHRKHTNGCRYALSDLEAIYVCPLCGALRAKQHAQLVPWKEPLAKSAKIWCSLHRTKSNSMARKRRSWWHMKSQQGSFSTAFMGRCQAKLTNCFVRCQAKMGRGHWSPLHLCHDQLYPGHFETAKNVCKSEKVFLKQFI